MAVEGQSRLEDGRAGAGEAELERGADDARVDVADARLAQKVVGDGELDADVRVGHLIVGRVLRQRHQVDVVRKVVRLSRNKKERYRNDASLFGLGGFP